MREGPATASGNELLLLLGEDSGVMRAALEPLGATLWQARSLDETLPPLDELDLAVLQHPLQPGQLTQSAAQLPILVVGAPPSQTRALLEAGAIDVLTSLHDADLLRAKVRALLRLKRGALTRAVEARAAAERAQRVAEEATKLKDAFLATLSHEMRTPLTSILGWVRLLRLGKASADPAGRALESIERNARLQSQLVADLIDVQRIASGQMSLAFREVELGTLLEAAVHGLKPAAEEAGVRLKLTRPIDEELRVFGNPDRLHQVFNNLFSNAIKFSPRDGQVHATLHADGTEVMILLRDEGRGMSPEFLPHAFDAFRQEDDALSRAKGGLGLGLSIVRHLVELHAGTVTVASEGEGQGTSFTVTLPLRSRVARPHLPAPREAPADAPLQPGGMQGARILVVEDDLDTQYLIVTILEQFGARVSAAGSAPEALSALGRTPFDLLLSDISMPGEDGYSLIRKVRGGMIRPQIPAAALTANARQEDRAAALAAGFQAHIAKPIDPSQLAQILTGLLRS